MHERIARVAARRERSAAATSGFLRTVWDDAAEPVLREIGRATIERAVQRACASIDHGQSPLEIIGDEHIARREKFGGLTARALEDGSLPLIPCYIAGGHGHIVALPGLLSVAIGTGVTTDMARHRATAELVARDLKLLCDPTRVLILTELDRDAGHGRRDRRSASASPSRPHPCTYASCARRAADVHARGRQLELSRRPPRLRAALQGAHDALLPAATTES